jgi:hypothetical protein
MEMSIAIMLAYLLFAYYMGRTLDVALERTFCKQRTLRGHRN